MVKIKLTPKQKQEAKYRYLYNEFYNFYTNNKGIYEREMIKADMNLNDEITLFKMIMLSIVIEQDEFNMFDKLLSISQHKLVKMVILNDYICNIFFKMSRVEYVNKLNR